MKSLFAFLALMAALCGAVPARAQDTANSGANFWLQERAAGRGGPQIINIRPFGRERAAQAPATPRNAETKVRRLVPNRRLAKPTNWREEHVRPHEERRPAEQKPAAATDKPADAPQPTAPASGAPAAEPAQTAAPAPPPVAAPEQKQIVTVVGDNLAFMLANGLTASAAETGRYEITRKARESSGLVRDDFYDWQKAIREIAADPAKAGVVAIMIGSNDRQELRDSAGRYEPLSPRWRELYVQRVDALLAPLREKKIPFVWVGTPVMKSSGASADLSQINEIFRAETEKAGGRYVDIWNGFADEKGRYDAFGPDVNGQIVKLRTVDGVHFTQAGARKLAFFTEQALRPLIDKPKPAPLAPPDVHEATPKADAPHEAADPQKPEAPPRPIAGPVATLTTAPRAEGGRLLGGELAQPPGAPPAAQPPPPASAPSQPQRADDFAWPRTKAN
ncbi:MAG: DUF459 domain-containing protein [Hyphomicrobiales bacterium]|nr:DUF459 domain-containing protein [Hyphomicrobiales bacterium]